MAAWNSSNFNCCIFVELAASQRWLVPAWVADNGTADPRTHDSTRYNRYLYYRTAGRGQPAGPGPAAAPAACQGLDGRSLARGLARGTIGRGERCLAGALCALVQAGLRRSAAPLPAHAAHRAGVDPAARHRLACHRHRVCHRLGELGHVWPHLSRHHRQKPQRAAAGGTGRGGAARQHAGVHPQGRRAAGPHDRSFGEAPPRSAGTNRSSTSKEIE